MDFLRTTEISAISAEFCLNFVAMATPFAPLKILIAYISICRLLGRYYSRKRFLSILERIEICAILAFLPKFGCHGNCLGNLKISDSILQFADPPKPYHIRKNWYRILYKTEICTIFAYFCLNLVAMATSLPPLKFQMAHLNSPTPISLPCTLTLSQYLVQNRNQSNFGLFLPKFGCHSNGLGSLEFSIAELNSRTPKNSTITQKLLPYLVQNLYRRVHEKSDTTKSHRGVIFDLFVGNSTLNQIQMCYMSSLHYHHEFGSYLLLEHSIICAKMKQIGTL